MGIIQAYLLQIYAKDSAGRVGIGIGSSGSFTENFTVLGTGNVGITKVDPGYKLHLYEAAAATNCLIVADNGTVTTFVGLAGGGTTFGIGTISNHDAIFYTNSTEQMRLKNTGVLKFANMPTSAAGLAAGEIWCDTSAGNVLKMV